MGIFGKLAYDEGATVGTLLATRFVLAAALFWLLSTSTGGARRPAGAAPAATSGSRSRSAPSATAPRRAATSRRSSGSTRRCSRCSSTRIPCSSPWQRSRSGANRRAAAPRSRSRWRRPASCSCSPAPPRGRSTRVGTALGLGAAVVYSAYILVSQGIAARLGPLALGTLVCTGAAVTLTLGAAASGDLHPSAVSPAGFAWLGGLAVVSTVGAIGLFFAGLRRVGPTAASILSTLEPVVTVALAFARVRRDARPRAARRRRARPAGGARRANPTIDKEAA